MKKLPKSIRIMGQNVIVVKKKNLKAIAENSNKETDEELLGQALVDDNEIRINSSKPIEKQKETLVHETIHFIEKRLCLGLTEEQVNNLSEGLNTVICDNKGVF